MEKIRRKLTNYRGERNYNSFIFKLLKNIKFRTNNKLNISLSEDQKIKIQQIFNEDNKELAKKYNLDSFSKFRYYR